MPDSAGAPNQGQDEQSRVTGYEVGDSLPLSPILTPPSNARAKFGEHHSTTTESRASKATPEPTPPPTPRKSRKVAQSADALNKIVRSQEKNRTYTQSAGTKMIDNCGRIPNGRPPNGRKTFAPPPASPRTSLARIPTQTHAALTGRRYYWESWPEVTFKVRGLPSLWNTLDLYKLLSPHGEITRIDIQEGPRGQNFACAYVDISPPPKSAHWVDRGLPINLPNGQQTKLEFMVLDQKDQNTHASPASSARMFPERMSVPAIRLEVGILKSDDTMVIPRPESAEPPTAIKMMTNMHEKSLDIKFTMTLPRPEKDAKLGKFDCHYRIEVPFSQLRDIHIVPGEGRESLIIPLDNPPCLYRKNHDIAGTHALDSRVWHERQAWERQISVGLQSERPSEPTQLGNEKAVIDVGRWLVYRLSFSDAVSRSENYGRICQLLVDHNVGITARPNTHIHTIPAHSAKEWYNQNDALTPGLTTSSFLSDLQQMHHDVPNLADCVQYQLEVCISQGYLSEYNIGRHFVEKLARMDKWKATKMLEKAADSKKRLYDPEDIFDFADQVSGAVKKIPPRCAAIRAAVVTPTTIYIATPTVETSNRVIRKYREHEDRFLRVRFTEERYKRNIQGEDSNDKVFTRIKHTMTNGIRIGDRLYEFLAFGNSQFREHGAYFFASTATLTASMIRQWMGNFTAINVVAKYASRLGQCFSTTRAITSIGVKVKKIQDIKRNDYCFTDGVGKISTLLAIMIADEFGLPDPSNNYPSLFQFRLAGCKGVLVVDPSIKGQEVHIRPSQEKFPATYLGLEIIRISAFSTATLNQQIILVLSSLGVQDYVFVNKLRGMLSDLESALDSESKALQLLQRNVDYNQMTLNLANMIFDGFMMSAEPFFVSLMRLWRAWSIKYLKEKAKISLEQGGFVYGCVDETGTLKGHFDADNGPDAQATDPADLPEIFLQISDPEQKGKYRVVEGLCTLARNPSLHPGDIRVVRAVHASKLMHLKNVVVLPQTGDRDLANMCSGGDLDGDEYLVIWDGDLLPESWNEAAMDYTAPPPMRSDGPVTVNDITSFFVTHMKYNNLPKIANAHKAWADWFDDGIKDGRCIALAHLHSRAVDFVKTGVRAEFPQQLRVKRWPHWMEKDHLPAKKIYKSKKILGRLYDEVERVPFVPAWQLTFDKRILEAFTLSEETIADAIEVKQQYDAAVRRIMLQHGIKSEFEVWSTFVLEHSSSASDYKLAETMGEIADALKQHHKELCYAKAGTTAKERDFSKLGPFVAAMYTVTAKEIQAAVEECNQTRVVGGQERPIRDMDIGSMPLMSFPWIFARELGQIAGKVTQPQPIKLSLQSTPVHSNKSAATDLVAEGPPTKMPEDITTEEGVTRGGDLLDLFHHDKPSPLPRSRLTMPVEREKDLELPAPLSPLPTNYAHGHLIDPRRGSMGSPASTNSLLSSDEHAAAVSTNPQSRRDENDNPVHLERLPPEESDGEDSDEVEEVYIAVSEKTSAIEALARLVGS